MFKATKSLKTKEGKTMGCGAEISDWDDKAVQDSMAGKNTDFDPKILAETMPQVREAMEHRCIECLKENVENAKDRLRETLDMEMRNPASLEKLDLGATPTVEEYGEFFRIGMERGIPEYEIANMPVIMGIKDPETLERMDIKEITKDLMESLHKSKLSVRFRDVEVADRIMFIDKAKGRTLGDVLGWGPFVSRPDLPRTIHIYQDPGAGKLPEGKQAQRVVIHEFVHLNLHKTESGGLGEMHKPKEFGRIFMNEKWQTSKEWAEVCHKQLAVLGAVTKEATENFGEYGSREKAYSDPEFIAEHVAMWDTGLKPICSEMRDFFEKHLS